MVSNEIRSAFLDFFAGKGHKIVPSSPVIPQNDPTLLFVNAGMNQFKEVFLGLEKRDYFRAASSQKCIRAGGKHNDLENVGFTARHHTFFEMLGNFSFGDYFKKEAIAFAWEYVTKILSLDPKRLYATVLTDDDEAERLWKKIAPELGDRVLRFGPHDNFWSMGETGPCGPCSEIHYDRGDKYSGELNGEGDRFMEIWNLVFMQYDRDQEGKLTPLPKPSVDTGAGLERSCMILQNGDSNYDTDLFRPITNRIEQISGIEYSPGPKGVSHRVIADHIRALTFAIADGVIISNEGRGYVLRRILRRAARHGRLLELREPFLYRLVSTVTDKMGDQYPEIRAKHEHIELVLRSEEEQFGRTLDTGLEIFDDIVRKVESSGSKTIPGEDVFRLYDTFGFPPDLTEVMAVERGLHVDMTGFEKELERQRERSKSSKISVGLGVAWDIESLPQNSRFIGYENEITNTIIIKPIFGPKLAGNGREVIILERTPFYPESGGQIGDTGKIYADNFEFMISDTQKSGDLILHFGQTIHNEIAPLEQLLNFAVTAEIDHTRRADIKRNHTATHLLHKALRMVLGEHVHQSGSLVAPERLRFDFTHFKAMTSDELDKVESIVREKISDDITVHTPENDDSLKNLTLDKAKAMGAMALFGEKYGDIVRMVTIDDFSKELCGGTHVSHTGDIGEFYITQETAIAAGMRRIEAVTGREAERYRREQERMISELENLMGRGADKLTSEETGRFSELLSMANNRLLKSKGQLEIFQDFADSAKQAQKKKEKEKAKKLSDDAGDIAPRAIIGDKKILIYIVQAKNAGDVMVFSDRYRNTYKESSIVTISQTSGNFAITSPDDGFGQTVMKAMSAVSGVRGGGKPTIRGSMPIGEIDNVIEILKKKFG